MREKFAREGQSPYNETAFMSQKQPQFIDGFGNRPRRRVSSPGAPSRPVRPATVTVLKASKTPPARPQAAATNFPNVGTTLKAYNYNAFDSNPTSTRHVKPVVKQGHLHWFKRHVGWKRVFVTLVVVGLLIGGWVGGKFLYNAHKIFGGSLLGIFSTTKLKGEDVGRVNILLAGNSADDAGHDGGKLTDSIMIMSIDTKDNSGFLLSVPRDLWVQIPGDGHAKINATYVVGEQEDFSQAGYPDGGMGLLEELLSEDLGINIDYYALINYSALKEAVDAVGGINFTVKSSDRRGLYDPSIDYSTHGPLVKLTNGTHLLNGQQALDLARARGDAYGAYGFAGSDFERTQNQRQMLIALKNKITSTGTLANPGKLSSLADAIGNNVTTDLPASGVHRLYDLVKGIDSKDIQSLSFNSANGKNLLASYTSPDGQSALAPAAGSDDFTQLQAFIRQQTSNNPVVRENADIVVLNATDVNGLAGTQQLRLINQYQLDVTQVADADSLQTTTSVIDASGGHKANTRKLLGQIYGQHFTTTNPYALAYPDADFIVLIGSDHAHTSSQND
jgi:LCP family protein required for cell wall assembly